MTRVSLWIAAAVLYAATFGIVSAEEPGEAAQRKREAEITPADAKPTSDQLWAEAIFLSFPSIESSSETVRSRLTAALLRAERKAPLYRALSALDSSPLRLREVFERSVAARETAFATEIEAGVAENVPLLRDAPPAVVEQTLRQILARSLQRTMGPQQVMKQATEINDILRHGTEFSDECLAAALAEEPGYAPAWFDLAVSAAPEKLDRATQDFLRADSENALAYLLRAGWLSDQENFDEAARLVEIAATKRHCRIYDAEFPQNFELRYPDVSAFRELQLVGRRVTPVALRNASYLVSAPWRWANPVSRSLKTLAYRLQKRAEALIREGKRQEGFRSLNASQIVCVCLICSEFPTGDLFLTGLGLQSDALAIKRRYSESEGRCAELDRFVEMRYARNRLIDLFRDRHLAPFRQECENLKGVFEGTVDLVESERRSISGLVREFGYALPWTGSARP